MGQGDSGDRSVSDQETKLGGVPAPADSSKHQPLFPWKKGQTIAERWVLLEPLGRGASGSVWRAQDLRIDGLRALKFISLNEPEREAQFENEARLATQVRGNRVARMFDPSEVTEPAGTRWGILVQEFIDGTPLDFVLRQIQAHGGLREGELRRILLGTLEGLADIHDAGLAHRDIKPSNLSVRGWDVAHRNLDDIVVLDLGTCTRMRGGPSNLPYPTVGTPGYMAPELLGSAQYANAATDLFSLGIVAMVAQTGANPQNWSGPLRQQEQQLAGLDERLKRSVLKAVEESSAERWQSAREWTRDLQEISARRSGPSPMVLGLVGLLLLGALGLGGVAVVGVLLVQADGGDASSAAPLPEVPVPSPVEAEVPVDLPDAAIYVSANGVDDVIEILVDGELVGTCIWDVADCSVNQYVALGQKTHAEVLFRLTNNEYEGLCLIGPCGKYSGEFEVRSEGGEALWSDRVYCHSNQGCPGANTPGVKYEKAYLWQR